MLFVKALCGAGIVGLIVWLLIWVFADYVGGPAQVLDAGHLLIDDRPVQLMGLDAPALNQPCKFAGTSWLCGLRAARELSHWLGERTVRCIPEGHTVSGEPLGLCYAGADDIARWLVEQGWGFADARASTRYIGAEEGARARLAGLWRSKFTVPRVWRASHDSLVRGGDFAIGAAPAMAARERSWRTFIPIGGLVFCIGLLVRWVPALRPRWSPSHGWRIRRSRGLLEKLKTIGMERGPGAQFAYLRKVDPLVVEELVLTALETQGHRIRRNARYTGDGGVDGRCWMDGQLHLIQVKRYGRHISPEDVRAFCEVCAGESAQGLFIHTGRTGPGSARLATETVKIISGARLLQLLGVAHTRQEPHIDDFDDGGREAKLTSDTPVSS
jgi:restriction system protein